MVIIVITVVTVIVVIIVIVIITTIINIQQTPQSRDLLEKITGSQLVKKLLALNGTQRLIPHSQ